MIEEIKRDLYLIGANIQKQKPRSYHNDLQEEYCLLAQKYGFTSSKEFGMYKHTSGAYKGFIDVVWFQDDLPILAIEIDSSLRKRSFEKLIQFRGRSIWVYTGFEDVYDFLGQYGETMVGKVVLPSGRAVEIVVC
ncbi:hypothetical protein QO009_003006 [Brevibacillus aydinogluensis]|uniref:hypothetical protein n=1 Tax=Brevibacillus aydinogluensis TaxID=927786 RepID=UPI00289315CB|nr:hypothetical protein [Brevibacillus aydinogluensis]MDT3417111.1 hypothetical protein [Brevibacillus aydinogluensis]